MIRLSGFEPYEALEIVFTGIRPGEKIFEEILTSAEGIGATCHQRIFVARPDGTDPKALERLLLLAGRNGYTATEKEVVALLRTILPFFRADKQDPIPDKGSEEVAFKYKTDTVRPVHSASASAVGSGLARSV